MNIFDTTKTNLALKLYSAETICNKRQKYNLTKLQTNDWVITLQLKLFHPEPVSFSKIRT